MGFSAPDLRPKQAARGLLPPCSLRWLMCFDQVMSGAGLLALLRKKPVALRA